MSGVFLEGSSPGRQLRFLGGPRLGLLLGLLRLQGESQGRFLLRGSSLCLP